MRSLTCLLTVLSWAGLSFGQDLNTLNSSNLGARAAGMAGTFVAMSGDPTCLFWNPAGIAGVKRPSVYAEGAYREQSQTEDDYGYLSSTILYEDPSSYFGHSTSARALAVLIPFRWAVLGLGYSVPYETDYRDGRFTYHELTIEPRSVGRVQRLTLSCAAGSVLTGTPGTALGFNINYDRFRSERASYYHSVYSWPQGLNETVDLNETTFEGRGYTFEAGMLHESGEALEVGIKVGISGEWHGQGNVLLYNYYYYPPFDTLQDTARVYEQSGRGTFQGFVPSPGYLSLGLRVHREVIALGAELNWRFGGDYSRAVPQPGSGIGAYDVSLDWNFGIPMARIGIEIQPLRGLFLRGGAYTSKNSSFWGSWEGDPGTWTGGLGFERKSLRADVAIERSAGGREKATCAAFGMAYAVGR